MRLKLSFLICLFLISSALKAQEFSETYMAVTAPSAEAAAIAKYGASSVNHYTGKAAISVPLYTLSGKRLSIPISLSYDHSGIKVDDEASWVGLGWTLNAGGVISRTIMGNDDFSNGELGWYSNPIGYLYSDEVVEADVNDSDWRTGNFPLMCRGVTDNQPDLFYYNFNGYSGKFILKRKVNPNDPVEVHMLSNDKMKITYDETSEVWTFITIDGSKYTFGTTEESQTWNGEGDSKLTLDPTLKFPDHYYNKRRITSWYLDKIETPHNEIAEFTYSTDDFSQETYAFSEMRRLSLSYNDGLCPAGTEHHKTGSKTGTFLKYLQKIEVFRNRSNPSEEIKREVRFNTSDRDDIAPYYNAYDDITYLKPQKLDNIEVYEAGQLIRSFSFDTYYTGAAPAVYDPIRKRMMLKEVNMLDATGNEEYDYKFEYNLNELPDKHSHAKDHWGYYNDAEQGYWAGKTTLIPQHYVFMKLDGNPNYAFRPLQGADREANEATAQAQILKKVIYPTGGSTTYDYELNEFRTKKNLGLPVDLDVTGNEEEIIVLERSTLVKVRAELSFDLAPRFSADNGPNKRQATLGDYPTALYSTLLRAADQNDDSPIVGLPFSQYQCAMDNIDCPAGITKLAGEGGQYPYGVILVEQERWLSAGTYVLKSKAATNWTGKMWLSYLVMEDPQNPTIVTDKGGGLRIKQITNHDGISSQNDIIKTYEYTTTNALGEEISSGQLMTIPNYHFDDAHITQYSVQTSAFTTADAIGCLRYSSASYSTRTLSNAAQGSPVGYDKVTEYTNGNGHTSMTFINETNIDLPNYTSFASPNSPTIGFDYKNGLPLSSEVYNEQGQILSSTTYDYDHSSEFNGRFFYFRNTGTCDASECLSGTGANQSGPVPVPWFASQPMGSAATCLQIIPVYYYTFYDMIHEFWYAKESTTTEYFYDNGVQSPVTTKSFYTYNTDHKQPIQEKREVLTANGVTRYHTKNTQYALDPGVAVPQFLLDDHIHNLPLHVEETIEGQRISAFQYDYSKATGAVNMETVKRYNLETLTYQPFRTFTTNEYGDLIKSSTLAHKQSYLYSRDGFYTLASVQNAEPDDFAHTSFEAHDGDGNWNIYGYTGSGTGTPPTGQQYHVIPGAGGYIQKSGLQNDQAYTLSFWARGTGTISITGGHSIQPTTEWKLYRVKIQKETSVSITTSTDIDFDEVNLFPEGSLMTTYTYQRGYGLTAVSRPDGTLTRYEYDDFGRLKAELDQHGNVLKLYEYAYNETMPATQQN